MRSLRRFRDEEVRETLESATGRPTLSLSRKRRRRTEARRPPDWSQDESVPAASLEATPPAIERADVTSDEDDEWSPS